MDLIYMFPEGMAAKRNLEKFLRQKSSPLDEVLGTDRWRPAAEKYVAEPLDWQAEWEKLGRPLVGILTDQLRGIGYQHVHLGFEIISVRNRNNTPLYYIIFASKHSLGHKLWQAISHQDPTGQLSFF